MWRLWAVTLSTYSLGTCSGGIKGSQHVEQLCSSPSEENWRFWARGWWDGTDGTMSRCDFDVLGLLQPSTFTMSLRLDALETAAITKSGELNPQNLANISWTLATLGKDMPLFSVIFNFASAKNKLATSFLPVFLNPLSRVWVWIFFHQDWLLEDVEMLEVWLLWFRDVPFVSFGKTQAFPGFSLAFLQYHVRIWSLRSGQHSMGICESCGYRSALVQWSVESCDGESCLVEPSRVFKYYLSLCYCDDLQWPHAGRIMRSCSLHDASVRLTKFVQQLLGFSLPSLGRYTPCGCTFREIHRIDARVCDTRGGQHFLIFRNPLVTSSRFRSCWTIMQ